MHPVATYQYTTTNIGDDFQSYAVEQIVGHRTKKVYRDRIYAHKEPVRLIGNCWYFVTRSLETAWAQMTGRSLFPPPKCIDPLYIGVSIGKRAERWMLTPTAIKHFQQHGPVGCRDTHTLQLLQDRGVDAWFSGCPTISMENTWGPRTDDIYIVDIDKPEQDRRGLRGLTANKNKKPHPDYRSMIPADIQEQATEISHFTTVGDYQDIRYEMVSDLIGKYATAKLVITSRLHVALPCAALGTPCVMLYEGDERLTGYEFLKRYNPETIQSFSWTAEEAAAPDVSKIKGRIRETVRTFVDGGSAASRKVA